jgi:hypothetical protein
MNRDAHAKATPEERAAQLMACEKAMSRFAGSLPVLGVTPETIPGIEISTKRFLGNFDAHLAQHRYVLGDAPCIGDFGLMGPL